MHIHRIFITLALVLGSYYVASARHIIGGVMTYRCLNPGTYEFTLKVYRDCNCTNCADFDPVASIGIYRCVGTNCSPQTGQSFPKGRCSAAFTRRYPGTQLPLPDSPQRLCAGGYLPVYRQPAHFDYAELFCNLPALLPQRDHQQHHHPFRGWGHLFY